MTNETWQLIMSPIWQIHFAIHIRKPTSHLSSHVFSSNQISICLLCAAVLLRYIHRSHITQYIESEGFSWHHYCKLNLIFASSFEHQTKSYPSCNRFFECKVRIVRKKSTLESTSSTPLWLSKCVEIVESLDLISPAVVRVLVAVSPFSDIQIGL